MKDTYIRTLGMVLAMEEKYTKMRAGLLLQSLGESNRAGEVSLH